MATLEIAYLMFEETIKRVVEYFKLDGKVYRDQLFHLYVIRITFVFTHKYLSIHDMVDYPPHEVDKKTILGNTVKHLLEIDFQFRYYFNPLWC